MERFEIEDIISQDENGINFRAIDRQSRAVVAIRRFFPFGRDNGGLQKDESLAFAIAAERLSEIKHDSLRSVIMAGTDPIDNIPYLVTEWVEGDSLRTILGDGNLDPGRVIDVLRIILELSTIVSHVLGEEAVWIGTEIESIIVGNEASGRGYTFRISPLKWLGSESRTKNLLSVVTLGEELTGWTGKLVSDQSGNGLGGWFKWLRNNPDISLHKALESLAASTGNEPPQSEEAIVQQAIHHTVKPKKSSLKAPIIIAAILIIIFGSIGLIYLNRSVKAEQTVVEASANPQNNTTAPKLSRVDEVNARAIKMSQEAAIASTRADAETADIERQIKERNGVFFPDDNLLVSTLKSSTPIKLQGTLIKTDFSSTGKSLYLYFSDPHKIGQIRGVIRLSDLGEGTQEAFNAFIGKEIVLTGSYITEPTKNPILVKIDNINQISLIK